MARFDTAAVLIAVLALSPTLAFAQTPAVCDGAPVMPPLAQGLPPAKLAPNASASTMTFNPALDPALETSFGSAASRTAVFLQAVNDWNMALANVGASLVLVPTVNGTAFSTSQAFLQCQDATDPGTGVYSDLRGAHYLDGVSEFSTADNPGGVNLDAASQPLGAGWVMPISYLSTDTSSSLVAIDQALANPRVKLNPVNLSEVQEADVVWYTHFLYSPLGSDPACVRTSWDFRYPQLPDANRYDFYSVMLHGIGHLLGIAHQGPDDTGNNCMQSTLSKGVRHVIGPKEMMCLCIRYGPGQPVCSTATPTHRSTWGQLKSTYR